MIAKLTHQRLSDLPLWRLLVALDDAERSAGADSPTVRVLARAVQDRLRGSREQFSEQEVPIVRSLMTREGGRSDGARNLRAARRRSSRRSWLDQERRASGRERWPTPARKTADLAHNA